MHDSDMSRSPGLAGGLPSDSPSDYDLASELGLSDAEVADLETFGGARPQGLIITRPTGDPDDPTYSWPPMYEISTGKARAARISPDKSGSTAWAADILHERGYIQ